MTQPNSTIVEARDGEQGRHFAIAVARLAADSHGTDVVVFDVRGMSQVTDYLVIATGTSDRQIKAVGSHIVELSEEFGLERLGAERDDASKWQVLDFASVMVHLFEPITRAHYDLEMLWGDAPRVNWRRSE